MVLFLENGAQKGMFQPHDVTVGTAIAGIVASQDNEETGQLSEMDMFARERASFIKLAKTPQTRERIQTMLTDGAPVRN